VLMCMRGGSHIRHIETKEFSICAWDKGGWGGGGGGGGQKRRGLIFSLVVGINSVEAQREVI